MLLRLLAGLTITSALDDGAAPLPPRGWSTWTAFELNINETLVMHSADIMAKEFLPYGYEYILIDDGWPAESAKVGGAGPARDPHTQRIPVSKIKFPSGMKALTDYVHKLKLKIGIYTAVSHWTCGGYTGSLGFEEVDAQAFVEWGFDFVKHDTCAGYNGEPGDECGVGVEGKGNCIKNSTTLMSKGLTKYAAAAGKQVVYYIDHGNPSSPQRMYNPHQYFVQTTGLGPSDVSKLAVKPSQLGWTWAADVCHMMKVCFDADDSWESMLHNLHSTVNLPEYQQRGYYNNPDMLTVGMGSQQPAQYRAQMLLWSVLGAPLIIGADIRKLDNVSKDLLTAPEVLAVNADPDCVQGSLLRSRDSYEIWGKPLRSRVDPGKNGAAFVVVMFNRGEQPSNVTLVLSGTYGDLYPAKIDGKYEVRDLLRRTDLGVMSGDLKMLVPPTDAVMLQIVPMASVITI